MFVSELVASLGESATPALCMTYIIPGVRRHGSTEDPPLDLWHRTIPHTCADKSDQSRYLAIEDHPFRRSRRVAVGRHAVGCPKTRSSPSDCIDCIVLYADTQRNPPFFASLHGQPLAAVECMRLLVKVQDS